jgi:hypothetical protein
MADRRALSYIGVRSSDVLVHSKVTITNIMNFTFEKARRKYIESFTINNNCLRRLMCLT